MTDPCTRDVIETTTTEEATMDRPDELRLDDQLCFALYAATNEVIRSYRPLLRRIGLTYPQYLVLMALWEEDGLSLSALAGRLHLPVNGVLPVVERLQSAGFLTRRQSRRDGRVVTVELTAAGAGLEIEALRAQREVVCHTGLSPDSLEGLRAELQQLQLRLSQPVDADPWDRSTPARQPDLTRP